MSLISCSDRVRLNSIGVNLQVNLSNCEGPVDLSNALSVDYIIEKPNGTIITRAATIVDAVGGIINYATQAGDLDQLGYYSGQISLVTTSFDGNSFQFEFFVVNDLDA